MQYRMLQAGPLLDERGALLEAGYALSPIKRYEREKIKAPVRKIKEWDDFVIMQDACAIHFRVSDLGQSGEDAVTFVDFDMEFEKTVSRRITRPMGTRGLPNMDGGTVRCQGKQYEFTFRPLGNSLHVYGHMYDFGGPRRPLLFDFILHCPQDDAMVLCTPFKNHAEHFSYSLKSCCLPADGRVIFDDKEYLFSPAAAFGTTARNRGVLPRRCAWGWSSASGIVMGKRFGLNLGLSCGDTEEATQNALFYDGSAHKLGNVYFHETRKNGCEDPMAPYFVTDDQERLRLTFTPLTESRSVQQDLLTKMDRKLLFGRFSGEAQLDSKVLFKIDRLTGFMEKSNNRW